PSWGARLCRCPRGRARSRRSRSPSTARCVSSERLVTEILVNLGAGLVAACAPLNLGMIVLGLVIGIIAGALPGVTMLNSIVLVLPFTYLMGIVPALLLMIGVYCGGVFGGSITGILFNIPGDPMNVPTTWEGYRMSRQGHTQYALGLAIMSSAFGGLVCALFLAFFALPFASLELSFSAVVPVLCLICSMD